jgi:phosphoribosylanthranilate isomerase
VTYVKVCGIASEADVEACLAAGVDALGFLCGLSHPSEDELAPERAAELARRVPPFVSRVLVTHSTAPAQVRALLAAVPVSVLQLQGDFPLDRIAELRAAFPHLAIAQAVHVTGAESLDRAAEAARAADAVLLDTRRGERLGGTGETHDWRLSRAIRDRIRPTPVVLAGGLDPENVAAAIETVLPFAVDVNTGVSARRGRKDPERVRRFVENARSAGR